MVVGKKHGHQGAGLFGDLVFALWPWSDTDPLGPLVCLHFLKLCDLCCNFPKNGTVDHLISSHTMGTVPQHFQCFDYFTRGNKAGLNIGIYQERIKFVNLRVYLD